MPVGMWVMRTAELVLLTCWPPGAAGPVGVDAQVLLLDVDDDIVVDFGIDKDGGKGGVAAAAGVKGGDAHQAVDAASPP